MAQGSDSVCPIPGSLHPDGAFPRIPSMRIAPSACLHGSPRRIGVRAAALLLAIFLLGTGPALGFGHSTWRCGNRLVATGDSFGEVLFRCGDPDFRSVSTEVVTVRLASGFEVSRIVGVETWTYDRGPRELVRFLTFRDGRLIRIAEGSYGG
jgi:hypothetical protein